MAGPEAVSNRDLEGLQKAPPNSIEAEEALLGSALLSRDAANRLMESVKSSDFYSPTNQTIFEAMKDLFDSLGRLTRTTQDAIETMVHHTHVVSSTPAGERQIRSPTLHVLALP